MTSHVITLPETGLIRQTLLIGNPRTGTPGLLPFSASTLWRKVKAGEFPKPVKLSVRITAWRAEDIRTWLDSHSVA